MDVYVFGEGGIQEGFLEEIKWDNACENSWKPPWNHIHVRYCYFNNDWEFIYATVEGDQDFLESSEEIGKYKKPFC